MGKVLGLDDQSFGNGLRNHDSAHPGEGLNGQSNLNLSQQSLHQNPNKEEYHSSKKRGYTQAFNS
ncbi:MAG: hypothetical protein ACMG6E_10635 [Candidatus Roizmanbacteria bacterium]